ncbi:ATP-grasp domain-containing protein [Paenibacillus sp.]|jgi:hypothetical protein|uniref:ATP-grasp domain-containing protein n=1 Tax=Paenibacillus sp. TaxID=58172 RepID=UPI00282333E2|nr:ATP-grasp domain-containing protein [Paenibacillus sp.]MDR0270820.1 ATP-grasp domain-containing protein [Paenibacillus sp.]
MSILILNKNARSNSPYDLWLEDLNEKLVILTTTEVAHQFQNGKYEYVEAFDNYENNGNVEKRAIELNKLHNFKRVIATSECDIVRAGRLRDAMGIEGQDLFSANSFRNKVLMKQLLKEGNVPVPNFLEVKTPLELLDFISTNQYPVVIKPISGSGSNGVTIINNDYELSEFLKIGISDCIEVEQFIDGDMYHVDGLVVNGQIVFSWPSKYINGCLSYRDGKYCGSTLLEVNNPLYKRLQQFTKSVITALPSPSYTTFHVETFYTPDDNLILCEIASRSGGGRIRESLEHAFGININMLWVRSQCNLDIVIPDIQAPIAQTAFLIVPPKTGILLELPESVPYDWVCDYFISGVTGKKYEGAGSSVDNIAIMILKGQSEIEVKERLGILFNWFTESCKWG